MQLLPHTLFLLQSDGCLCCSIVERGVFVYWAIKALHKMWGNLRIWRQVHPFAASTTTYCTKPAGPWKATWICLLVWVWACQAHVFEPSWTPRKGRRPQELGSWPAGPETTGRKMREKKLLRPVIFLFMLFSGGDYCFWGKLSAVCNVARSSHSQCLFLHLLTQHDLLTQPDSLDTEQNILVYNAWVHCVVWSSLSSLPILYIKLRGL